MKLLFIFALTLAASTAFVVEKEGRITNGEDAKVGQFPYTVGLALQISNRPPKWCGGSLISPEWILTAAHCTKDSTTITVFLGATDRQEPEQQFDVQSSSFVVHPDYDAENHHDIALIKIPAVTLTENIKIVQLPAKADSYSSYEGDYAFATGWGQISETEKGTDHLQWARLQVISNDDCKGSYAMEPTIMCVGTPDKVSTCKGDSGGPLVLDSDGAPSVQIGITVSGSPMGCEYEEPAAFTRVTSYLGWIHDHTGIEL